MEGLLCVRPWEKACFTISQFQGGKPVQLLVILPTGASPSRTYVLPQAPRLLPPALLSQLSWAGVSLSKDPAGGLWGWGAGLEAFPKALVADLAPSQLSTMNLSRSTKTSCFHLCYFYMLLSELECILPTPLLCPELLFPVSA